MCCLVLRSNFALLLTIQFILLFFFLFFFSARILSWPYLWNRYSQRLQIEFAAWSCSLILHCCLPSNSLRYFFFFLHDFVRSRVFHLRGIAPRSHTGRPRTCLIIIIIIIIILIIIIIIIIIIISDPRRECYMGLLRSFFFSLFFSATILSGPYLWNRYSQTLQIECAAWSCGLILHCCLPSNSLRYLFFFLFFRHDFVRAISLESLLAETPN